MCRIAGIVGFNEIPFAELNHKITEMRDSMYNGGPDDFGLYMDKFNQVALGHRRLSILDLTSMGHQPMKDCKEEVWISYNGEIYNFKELKNDLINLGHKFNSNTDTEVIIKSYLEWGEESFRKFNGMFAFSLYDKENDKILLVRDQSGIKPLYYSILNDQLIFASEVKAFKKFNKNWCVNYDWQIMFLTFGFIPEPYTTLKNVFMLPKGHFLSFNVKSRVNKISRYSVFNKSKKIDNRSEAEYTINKTLQEAVKRQLVSDAPIGVFLSGGLDSSILTTLASKYKEKELNTLSLIFNESQFNEQYYQNLVVSRINSNHSSFLVTEDDFVDNIENIFNSMDQPSNDGINSYFITKYAKEFGLKAVISGIGADELFGGYPSFKRIDVIVPLFKLQKISSKLFNIFEYISNEKYKRFSYLKFNNPLSMYLIFRGFYSMRDVCSLLDISKQYYEDVIESLFLCNDFFPDKEFISYLEQNIYMQNQLLKDTDYMGMNNSIEVRVPFLDKEFQEVTSSIVPEVRFNSGRPKGLLINTFSEFLPDEIINREKMGFTFPFSKWFRSKKDVINEILGITNDNLTANYSNFLAGNLHWSRLWSLFVLNNNVFV